MNKLPIFFNYDEEGPTDNGYEAMQDFFLSWTLRCAEDKYRNANVRVHEYAKKAVFLLLYGHNRKDSFALDKKISENFKVTRVETKRQNGGVDLIALITIDDNNLQPKKFALNIENKWYSPLKEHQLEKGKTHVESTFPDYQVVNLFITCDDCRKNYEQEKRWCRDNQYKFLTISDIADIAEMNETGNDLFDAYWFDK
ncbi:PD-(D/E)XK nuclease family protein [Puia dinghuensis]|uniref:Uncharacterized protein n=1 Tax=Puia dinghuensis TaxID=1792502 RepID=A0A8J2XU49_9BACT|nr:PD-(D/E)XK nuclease family protein [Puia dinghuensis]GGB22886.1 hypothetical protein GCM10011511_53510 [Puia dinghuensis]